MIVESNDSSIGWAVARLARQVELTLATVELSSAQYRTLLQLAHDADAATSLAKKLAVTAPSVSNVVDGLVQRGAIERTHSIDDRRRISLALTGIGRDLVRAADNAVRSKLESIADELDDKALAAGIINGLAVWGEALDRARMRRLAAPGKPAAAPK